MKGCARRNGQVASSLRRVLWFFSNKFISYLAFYVGTIQTEFLREFQKSYYGGTGIVIPVKKSATGTEKTGIRRIPAGITNLAWTACHECTLSSKT